MLPQGSTLHYPGASVGVVPVSGDLSVDQALQQADHAMYHDKQLRHPRGGRPGSALH
ncbi:UNVERIFIED_ORG: putative signal transduction protein with EAL and GGDEF domain [Comamonas terrigena]